ncbi:MAG: hypothetical protein KDC95_19530, partial [Planctomycetes bacterium]|nr:hypothetical protein [Planctomycetota bacterium]
MRRGTRRQPLRPWTAFEEGRGRVSRAKRRLAVLASCILLAPIFLGMRLFNLQIVKAEEMRLHRTRNLHGVEWLHAKRGTIADSSGRVLVEDESQFVLRFVYRDFRRGHVCGLLVHLDRFLRELQTVTRDGPDGAIVPDGIVDGEPLTYVDPVERFEAAALRTLDLRISLLRRDGPLGKRLRSVLRFYVFHVLDQTSTLRHHGIPVARVFEGLDGADRDLPVATFVASSGGLPWTAVDVAGEVVARVRKQIAALDELAGILGPRLTLPGSMTRVAGKGSAAGWVSEHGDLFAWLDACDRLHDRRTEARVDELRARQAEFVPGFWSRVFDACFPAKAAEGTTLSRRLANALTAGTRGGKHATEFEERIALRFRSEYGPVVVEKPVEFESVVALVLGKRESYPGFEVGEELRRRYPTLDPRGRPYSFLGITQWRESVDDAAKPTLVLGDELDSDVDGTKRLHLAEDEREIWQEEVKRRLLSEFRVREGLNNLEAYLDPLLTGQAGWRALLRDRTGQERFSPTHVAARRGHDVELTIDHEVQDLLDSALEEASLETINGHSLDRAKV